MGKNKKSIELTREDFLNEVSNEWHKLSWEEFQKVSHLGGEAFNTGHGDQQELKVELEATERWYKYQLDGKGNEFAKLHEHWSNRYVVERDRNLQLNNTIAEKNIEAENRDNINIDLVLELSVANETIAKKDKKIEELKATIKKLNQHN